MIDINNIRQALTPTEGEQLTALYANELCVIPSWGYTHAPSQPVNIKINIIYRQ